MRIEVEPRRLTVPPGEPTAVTVLITNTGDVIAGYGLRLLGADPAWVRLDEPEPRLFPGESAVVTATLQLPAGVPAGARRMAVQVRELTGREDIAIEEIVLDIPGARAVDVQLEPATVTGGRRAGFDVIVRNTGNTVVDAALVGSDDEHALTYAFTPPRLLLSPGEHVGTELRVSAKRRMFGSPVPRAFELRVDERPARVIDGPLRAAGAAAAGGRPGPPAPRKGRKRRRLGPEERAAAAAAAAEAVPDTPPAAMGVFLQKPLFSRGLLSLVWLVAAISVFALVITVALNSIVSRSAADRDIALQVAQAREVAAKSGTSGMAGQVLLISTGEPLAGVSVDVFGEADTSAPLTTTASDETGAWAFTDLPAGTFKLRLRGAGFAEVWYPAAATDAEAAPIEVPDGDTAGGLTVLLGGVPATVAGTVVGEDVAGATARLDFPLESPALAGQVPTNELADAADGPRTPGAVVRTVPVGGDGEFALEQIASPAVYDLVVTKPGFSEQVQRIDLAAGENRADLEIQLLDGDGSIAGYVTGAEGPIGGATVTATFGETTARTVSLTEDDVGAFTLRGLPTPGTFTVVVTAPGHASATLSLSLSPGQQLTGVAATLGAASGSLGGTVTAPAGGGGVSVTVTDGSDARQTVTQSTAPVGAWTVAGLRIPNSYTVTFTRADLASQVVSVSIDGYGNVTAGAAAPDRVDAAMRSATATLRGTVEQYKDAGRKEKAPAPNVQVTASSGTAQYAVTTASTGDVGAFVIEDLPPGTYTVTFARRGTSPVSEIVTLEAAQVYPMNPVLVAPASITGTVTAEGGPGGLTVRLHPAAQYGTGAPPRAITTTDGAGRFTFADVDAPAHYIVEVLRAGVPAATSAPITVDPSETAEVALEIDPTEPEPTPAPTRGTP
ncbi:carboxypeptidase regulatory-like domain-containing protein [Georgenia yuyongxinii]